LQIFLNIIYFVTILSRSTQQSTCDFIQINALCRNKISILCNINIQRASLTVQRSPSEYYGVFQETEAAAYIFQWLSSDYDLCECEENTMCGYEYNVCRSLRKRERIDHDYPTTDSGNSRHAEATHFTPTQETNRINNPTALSTCESTRRLLLTCDLLKELSLQIFIPFAPRKENDDLNNVSWGNVISMLLTKQLAFKSQKCRNRKRIDKRIVSLFLFYKFKHSFPIVEFSSFLVIYLILIFITKSE